MSEPNSGGWKSALLATGKPLEKSVAERVAELEGARSAGEYSFSRFNPEGRPVKHSVDLRAVWGDLGRDIRVEFLIEAKHRSRPKTWIYRRSYAKAPGGVSSARLIQSTDDLNPGRHFNRNPLAERADYQYPLGTEPFELNDPIKTGKPSPCDDGGRQLTYGLASLMAEAAVGTLTDGHLRFVLPIAVTTATLRVLKSNPSMEEVEAAKALGDLTEEVPLLVSRFPARDIEEHVRHRLREIVRDGNDRVAQRFGEGPLKDPLQLAKSVASKMDGTYLVVNYDRLPAVLQRATAFCVAQTSDLFSIRHIDAAKAAVALTGKVSGGRP